jgi:archaellum component FlaC
MTVAPEKLQRLLDHAKISSSTLDLLVKQYPSLRDALLAHICTPSTDELGPVNPALVQLLATLQANLVTPQQQQLQPQQQPATAPPPEDSVKSTKDTIAAQSNVAASSQSLLGRLQKKLEQIQGRSVEDSTVTAEPTPLNVPLAAVAIEQSDNLATVKSAPSASETLPLSTSNTLKSTETLACSVTAASTATSGKTNPVETLTRPPRIIEPGELVSGGSSISVSPVNTSRNYEESTLPPPPKLSSALTGNQSAVEITAAVATTAAIAGQQSSSDNMNSNIMEAAALVLHRSSPLTAQMQQEMQTILQSMEQDERELESVHGKMRHHDSTIQEIQKSIDELLKKISTLYVLLSKNRTTLTEHQQSKQNLLREASRLTVCYIFFN